MPFPFIGGAGFLSGLGGFASELIPGLVSGFGGAQALQQLNQGRQDILDLPGGDPLSLTGAFGQSFGGTGFSQLNPQLQALQGVLGASAPGLLAGGFSQTPGVGSSATQAGATLPSNFQNLQTALGTQAGPQAFGNLGGLFNQASGVGNILANQTLAGPRDVSGGVQGQLFGAGLAGQGSSVNPNINNQLISSGFGNLQNSLSRNNIGVGNLDFSGGAQSQLLGSGLSNQLAAGNQQGLFNQSLATQRQAATQGGLLDRAINTLQNRQFNTGRLGSTGGAQETQSFLDAVARQDLGFQNNAFNQAQQQQQFLGNLGGQQVSQGTNILGQNLGQNLGISQFLNQQQLGRQGLEAEVGLGQLGQGLAQQRFAGELGLGQTQQAAGLLGQSLGQFTNTANLANAFLGRAGGLEGQGFNQALGALQQNQTAAGQRLAAAQQQLGFADELFGSSFNRGLGATEGLLGLGQLGLDVSALPFELQAGLLGASGARAGALADIATARASGTGGLFGGIADTLGGLFG